jgi:hypothetical protein
MSTEEAHPEPRMCHQEGITRVVYSMVGEYVVAWGLVLAV